jgi:hypothetical protein
MNTYKADYEDDNFEIITACSDNEAIEEGFELQQQHGILFNVTLLDTSYNEVKTIL